MTDYNQKIERYAHEVSKRIAELALSHGRNTIVIGRNVGLKNGSWMDKKNNQNFYQILRKVVPNAYADWIEGVGLHPVKVNLSF